ncbi:hypothetical protein BGX24_002656 [Mortierella sp. AD032]|nr:hypothetical protein BGX24_002656 [Mortierella sp. AD032]
MMQVAQMVEIKHYTKTIEKGNIRVVIVIAFGPRADPPVNNPTDFYSLGEWLMLKVIEDFRYGPNVDEMALRSCDHINPDDIVYFESLEPRQSQITMHGRIAKLYSMDRPQPKMPTADGGRKTDGMDVDTHKKVGGVTIFRTQNSDMASGIVITKFLFRNGETYVDMDKRTHSNMAVSRGLSFMTPSRDHSDFGHLLVMFNQHARGMVWDWVHRRQEQNQGRSDSLSTIDSTRSTPTATASPPKAPLISEVKRFDCKTFGACLPEQEKTHAE